MSLSCEVRLGPRAARNDFGQGIVDAGSGSDSGVLRKYYTMLRLSHPGNDPAGRSYNQWLSIRE